jgi:hypothetical protein
MPDKVDARGDCVAHTAMESTLGGWRDGVDARRLARAPAQSAERAFTTC